MPAPAAPGALPLALPVPIHVELRGYTLLAYKLPEARLRPWVPEALALDAFEEQGVRMTWLTIFLGENVLQRVDAVPAPPLSFFQVNYRAYVRTGEGVSLFIFRSVVDNPLVATGARWVLNFPAVYEPMYREGQGSADQMIRVGQDACELELATRAAGPLPGVPGFDGPEAAKDYLADVPVALFSADWERLGKLISPHPPLTLVGCVAERSRLSWANKVKLLTEEEAARPLAVYWQARAPFPLRM